MKKYGIGFLVSMTLLTAFSATVSADDKAMCERYKERLKQYEREGVQGINPATGKVEKMEASQAREVIQDTKENIKLFCN